MIDFKEKLLVYKATTKKDPESFGLLYDLYVEKIYRFIYFKVGSKEEAEDITSEVFLKVWNHISEDKEIKSFSGLLYRVARNSVIDYYRSRARDPQIVSLENESENETERGFAGRWYDNIDIKMEAQTVMNSLEKLKQEYQEAITLYYIEGLKIAEIAAIMNKNQTSIRVLLHRAVKKLKEITQEK